MVCVSRGSGGCPSGRCIGVSTIEQGAGRVWGVSREACRLAGLPLLAPVALVAGIVVAASPLREVLALFWIPAVVGGGWFVLVAARAGRLSMALDALPRALRHGALVEPRDFRLAARVLLTWDAVMRRSGGAVRTEETVPVLDAKGRKTERVRSVVVERPASLKEVRSRQRGLAVTLRVPVGMDPSRFNAVDTYAASWGVASARARQVSPGVVEILLVNGEDLLLSPVAWSMVPTASADFRGALPVALSEDGSVVALQQAHCLVLGATGSGKGSVLWSIVRAVIPAAERGLVSFIGLDSKASEVKQAEGLFCQFGYSAEDHARIFRDLAELVAIRGERHSGREFTPSAAEPLTVVVIDEVTSLASIFKDSKERTAALADLRVVLSLGRSRGVLVVAAGQDPTKEALPLRNLFPQVVALRLRDATETRVALGEAAEESGATPHRIPVASRANGYASAGIGYVQDETGELKRCRFPYMSDDGLRALVGLLGDHTGHGCARVTATEGVA